MNQSAAEIVREYGPFPGADPVHGVTYDGQHVWFAAGEKLIAFDPATVGGGRETRVHDFPGGADRLVAHPTGVEHVWVRGTAVRRDGADLAGVRPGRLLRKGVG